MEIGQVFKGAEIGKVFKGAEIGMVLKLIKFKDTEIGKAFIGAEIRKASKGAEIGQSFNGAASEVCWLISPRKQQFEACYLSSI